MWVSEHWESFLHNTAYGNESCSNQEIPADLPVEKCSLILMRWKIGYKIIVKEHDSLPIHCEIDNIQTENKMQYHSYSSIQKHSWSKVCFTLGGCKEFQNNDKGTAGICIILYKHSWVFYKEKTVQE